MEPVGVVHRVRSSAVVLLLVAMLAAAGMSTPLPAYPPWRVASDSDVGAAVGGVRVDAMAPSRTSGRLMAEPAPVSVPALGDGVPGVLPSELPPVDLVAHGGSRATVPPAPIMSGHGTAGVRAPPA